MTTRRIAIAFFLFCLFLGPTATFAADSGYPPPWPDSDVLMTVPFNRGSEADVLFSLLKPPFEAATGKKMTVSHVPGRAGADGWARMVDDAPTGATVTIVVLPDAFMRSLQPDSGVSLNAMAVSNVIASMPCVLWVVETSPLASLNALVDAAKDMNGAFILAGPGRYSAGQVASRAFNREAGIRTTFVPYVDSVSAAKAALDKKVQAFWGYSAHVAVTEYPEAKFRALAVAGVERLPSLPDVPTFRELGINLVQGVNMALAVPVATPKITLEEISEYFSGVAKDRAFRMQASGLGFIPLDVGLEEMPLFLTEIKTTAKRQVDAFELHSQ